MATHKASKEELNRLQIVKRLVKHGDELALEFDQELLDLLSIDEQTEFHIFVENGRIEIIPLRYMSQERFKAAYEWTAEHFGDMLKRLADK